MSYNFQVLPQIVTADVQAAATAAATEYDHAMLIYHDAPALSKCTTLPILSSLIPATASEDPSFDKNVNVLYSLGTGAFKRVITSCTGKLNRDYDDVRRFADAVSRAVRRAKASKLTRPLLIIQRPDLAEYEHYLEVCLLAALAECHEQLQARELSAEPLASLETIGLAVIGQGSDGSAGLIRFVSAVENGRRLARDIGGADPERMTALTTAAVVQQYFATLPQVKVAVMRDGEELKRNYPLLMAVARGSDSVPRHAPCVISLEYRSADQEAVEEELFLVGKGVTYDTGGLDLKVNGSMVNMSKDKCGAAAVAGFMAAVAHLQPQHLNVTCKLAMVRNSIGPNGYVADEVLVSRAGIRVKVGNTDAEGRMAMADVLSEMRELAAKSPARARIFTCATLTGHASVAVGPYPIAMDNGPARRLSMARSLAHLGSLVGEPFEVSTVRREDFKNLEPKSSVFDVEQIVPASVRPKRGHQYPAAFLQIISGLDKHGQDSDAPIPYTHLDIAGVMDDGETGKPTAMPVVALAARFLYERMRPLVARLK